jgi:hypothetical protein
MHIKGSTRDWTVIMVPAGVDGIQGFSAPCRQLARAPSTHSTMAQANWPGCDQLNGEAVPARAEVSAATANACPRCKLHNSELQRAHRHMLTQALSADRYRHVARHPCTACVDACVCVQPGQQHAPGSSTMHERARSLPTGPAR